MGRGRKAKHGARSFDGWKDDASSGFKFISFLERVASIDMGLARRAESELPPDERGSLYNTALVEQGNKTLTAGFRKLRRLTAGRSLLLAQVMVHQEHILNALLDCVNNDEDPETRAAAASLFPPLVEDLGVLLMPQLDLILGSFIRCIEREGGTSIGADIIEYIITAEAFLFKALSPEITRDDATLVSFVNSFMTVVIDAYPRFVRNLKGEREEGEERGTLTNMQRHSVHALQCEAFAYVLRRARKKESLFLDTMLKAEGSSSTDPSADTLGIRADTVAFTLFYTMKGPQGTLMPRYGACLSPLLTSLQSSHTSTAPVAQLATLALASLAAPYGVVQNEIRDAVEALPACAFTRLFGLSMTREAARGGRGGRGRDLHRGVHLLGPALLAEQGEGEGEGESEYDTQARVERAVAAGDEASAAELVTQLVAEVQGDDDSGVEAASVAITRILSSMPSVTLPAGTHAGLFERCLTRRLPALAQYLAMLPHSDDDGQAVDAAALCSALSDCDSRLRLAAVRYTCHRLPCLMPVLRAYTGPLTDGRTLRNDLLAVGEGDIPEADMAVVVCAALGLTRSSHADVRRGAWLLVSHLVDIGQAAVLRPLVVGFLTDVFAASKIGRDTYREQAKFTGMASAFSIAHTDDPTTALTRDLTMDTIKERVASGDIDMAEGEGEAEDASVLGLSLLEQGVHFDASRQGLDLRRNQSNANTTEARARVQRQIAVFGVSSGHIVYDALTHVALEMATNHSTAQTEEDEGSEVCSTIAASLPSSCAGVVRGWTSHVQRDVVQRYMSRLALGPDSAAASPLSLSHSCPTMVTLTEAATFISDTIPLRHLIETDQAARMALVNQAVDVAHTALSYDTLGDVTDTDTDKEEGDEEGETPEADSEEEEEEEDTRSKTGSSEERGCRHGVVLSALRLLGGMPGLSIASQVELRDKARELGIAVLGHPLGSTPTAGMPSLHMAGVAVLIVSGGVYLRHADALRRLASHGSFKTQLASLQFAEAIEGEDNATQEGEAEGGLGALFAGDQTGATSLSTGALKSVSKKSANRY
ncbi:hypothetical protein KIPB_004990, partial [Kipferlia bialata]|eukprot:g4990.t1